ncbi:MAG: SulP family inorganic anion transporter [Accumulibacter sp.]|uniref:SulP family inorganic anion transporter n=1 Tax=Accumulibacter sp. TaxID=2053492 RepID=UPI0033147489
MKSAEVPGPESDRLLGIALLAVEAFGLQQAGGVKVVGEIPSGIPALALKLSAPHWRSLLIPALLIAFMIFLSSQSAAQALAEKRGEKITVNHELLGLGAANLASAFGGGFPVTGSISRSAVNYAAGANTPLASVISAALIVLALSVPTGWLALLPLPALAATIIVAVLGMIDFTTLYDAWCHDRSDAGALLATTAGVLLLGVEEGVIRGVVLSLATLLWRASRPHIAVLGRIPGSEHFRNVQRHQAETLPTSLFVRIDADLFFGNVDAVVTHLDTLLKTRALSGLTTRHLVLVMSAVSLIDTTGLYALQEINRKLQAQGIVLHLAEVKVPVMDRLQHSKLLQSELSGQVFLSAAQAFRSLGEADSRPA